MLRPVTVAQDAGTYRAIPGRNEYLGIFVTSWNRSLRPGLYGALWAPMGPYGALLTLWSPVEPYGAPLNLWLYRVFYGALWSITKPKEPCGAMDHYEDQRSPMEPYGGS